MFTARQTAQAKGSASVMVTVAAIQELKAGDFLLQFKTESRDNVHGSRSSIRAWQVFGFYFYIWDCSYINAMLFFFYYVGLRVCVCVCVCLCVSVCVCVLILAPTPKSHQQAKKTCQHKNCTHDHLTSAVLGAVPA